MDILEQCVGVSVLSKMLLEICVMHFGVTPRRVKNPSDHPSFAESKRVNEAERKTERRRMNTSSQRVEGYSFLILFCEVDRQPNYTRGASSGHVQSWKRIKNFLYFSLSLSFSPSISLSLSLFPYLLYFPVRSQHVGSFLIPELKISLHVRDVCALAVLSKSCYPMPGQSAISVRPELK